MQSSAPLDGEADIPRLHQALVDKLTHGQPAAPRGLIHTPSVEAAFRAVPRHLFLPDIAPEQAYRDEAISTKQQDGVSISASSQPAIMAIMLEQLGLEPGQRVLEIGAGTGYNAALMAHIVGDAGQVTTVDIDDDIVENARAHLAAAGFGQVQVVCADGALGYPDGAPYDRIILTVGASDIAPAWWEQLKPGGRLVLPLALHGVQASIAFEHAGGCLQSLSLSPCGFMMLRGSFAAPQTNVALGPEPGLSLRTDNPEVVDAAAVYRWLTGPRRERPASVRIAYGELWRLLLWLAAREPRYCLLGAEGEPARRGLVPWLYGWPGKTCLTNGLVGPDGLAVLMLPPELAPPADLPDPLPPPPAEPPPEPPPFELLIAGFGPDEHGEQRLITHITAWDAAGRPGLDSLRLRAYPRDSTYVPAAHETAVQKTWTRLVLSWA